MIHAIVQGELVAWALVSASIIHHEYAFRVGVLFRAQRSSADVVGLSQTLAQAARGTILTPFRVLLNMRLLPERCREHVPRARNAAAPRRATTPHRNRALATSRQPRLRSG